MSNNVAVVLKVFNIQIGLGEVRSRQRFCEELMQMLTEIGHAFLVEKRLP